MVVSEYRAPVANLTTIEKNGKSLDSYFVSGDAYSLSVRGNNPYDELIKEVPVEDVTIVVTVTGEAVIENTYLMDKRPLI